MTEDKKPVGRPSKLNDELLQKAIIYLVQDFEINDAAVPSLAGLALYLKVNKDSLYEFARVDSELGREFSDTLKSIKEKQEFMLINGGLKSTFNSTITKLMLSNHGYSDKVETDHTSSDGSMSPVTKVTHEIIG
jgi:hypothetical protein